MDNDVTTQMIIKLLENNLIEKQKEKAICSGQHLRKRNNDIFLLFINFFMPLT